MCRLFTCFVWVVDVVGEDYACVVDVIGGGLRVNGYFVCVGCVEKYDGDK